METLGKRIRQLRQWRGISQAELERRCAIKREYLSKLENDDLKNPTFKTMSKIATALGVPLTNLIDPLDKLPASKEPVIRVMSGDTREHSLPENTAERFVAVPLVGQDIVAANPKFIVGQDIKRYTLVPREWVAEVSPGSRYRCFVFDKKNYSMYPLVPPGSIVGYDTLQCDPQKLEKQLVVIRTAEGEVLVRRIKKENDYLIAIPENIKEYNMNIFPINKDNPIVGKVVWCLSQVNGNF